VPFVKELMNSTSRQAAKCGSIGTILGRRCRFNKWEIDEYTPGVMSSPMTRAEALAKALEKTKKSKENEGEGKFYGIKRCWTYKALNKLIQGSAADMTKKAMLDLYKKGIIPHIQIHDELDISVESDKQAKEIIEIMEKAVKLEIPNKVDYESGENWGDIYNK
tara:strand:+ start:1608 stop:2096 length:489 start_codon:yes stop_codon:yes gene_type:complete